MTEWSLTKLRQLQTWFCNCLLKINSQPSPRSLWRSKPLYVEIYLVMISPHISIIQWWKLTRVLQFPIFKVIEPKDIHDLKKEKKCFVQEMWIYIQSNLLCEFHSPSNGNHESFNKHQHPHQDLARFPRRAPLRCLPLVSQKPLWCENEMRKRRWTDCSVPNTCSAHRSASASRRSIQQEDLFNYAMFF